MTVFAITSFSHAPILLINVALPLEHHLSSLAAITAQIRRFTDLAADRVWIIVDLRGCDVSLSDALLLIAEYKDSAPDRRTVETLAFIAVGTHPMIRVGLRRIWEQLAIPVTPFEKMSDALAHVRRMA